MQVFTWLGDNEPHLDMPATYTFARSAVGIYGGNTRAGAQKNEDAALIMMDTAGEWEFALLIDAHYSAESARLVLEDVNGQASRFHDILDHSPLNDVFRRLEEHLVRHFSSPEFLARTREVHGEASCLICARRDGFLWWMSIGDCLVYLLHPELAVLGQFALNQRSFFEWIGFRNAFSLAVPCYASGVRELLQGQSVICLATDGLFEGEKKPLISDQMLYRAYMSGPERSIAGLQEQTQLLLNRVHHLEGRDSATVIAWSYETTRAAMDPSN